MTKTNTEWYVVTTGTPEATEFETQIYRAANSVDARAKALPKRPEGHVIYRVNTVARWTEEQRAHDAVLVAMRKVDDAKKAVLEALGQSVAQQGMFDLCDLLDKTQRSLAGIDASGTYEVAVEASKYIAKGLSVEQAHALAAPTVIR